MDSSFLLDTINLEWSLHIVSGHPLKFQIKLTVFILGVENQGDF